MAANRYGQIWHGDHHHINIRFPSNEARLKFQNEFEAYHASHDHEGDVPTFKLVNRRDLKIGTGDRDPKDLVKVEANKVYRITIDGYSWNEIHDYHNPSSLSRYSFYRVPTCCVPPTIVIGREFVDSGTLQRHELSAIFGDMPDTDFQSLLESVQTDGFIDPIIRIHEGKILDGWHRYRAAQELNLIRRLKFQEWDEDADRDGDPKVFVYGRNLNRRHYSAAQRAQIAVAFNKRFRHGGDRKSDESSHQDDGLKSREELAKETGVGIATIDRAIAVEKGGQSEVVIRGEKTPGQLEREAKEKRYAKLCKAINAFNRVWQKTRLATQVSLTDDFFPAAAEALGFPINTVEQVNRCQDTPASEEKMKGFTGLAISSWESYFDEMRTALIEKPEWVESLENETNTEDALEHLYQHRQDFQTAVSDFAQSGAYLNFSYCRRRIKELIGLEDSTDEGSTDYTQWDLQKIKEQSHLITETVQVIRGYLEEDPKIETHPVAELLSEMQRIHEIHQSAKLDTYTRPFQHQPLSDAVERIEELWTADWEAKSDEERLDDLNELETELPSLIEAEDTARAASPEETVNDLWAEVTEELPKWKQRYGESGKKENERIQSVRQENLIETLRDWEDSDATGPATVGELKELLALMKSDSFPFIFAVRMLLRGALAEETVKSDSVDIAAVQRDIEKAREKVDANGGMVSFRPIANKHGITEAEVGQIASAIAGSFSSVEPEQQTYEQKQREHVNRLESLPGQIRSYLPTWQQAHGIEVTLTLKLLLNARCQMEYGRERGSDPFFREEMEDLLQRMKSNDKDLVEKVRKLFRGAEPVQEQSNSAAQYEDTLVAIEKLKTGLKQAHVVAIEEIVDDILHFYNGIGVSDLLTSPQETLKNISDFIEGFVDQPFAQWPEYIRNHRWVPKRELVLVSIGINNNTDDEFEVVEFTDESSDEIGCKLNALPEDLRTALLKVAAEKIYAEAVKEFHTDD